MHVPLKVCSLGPRISGVMHNNWLALRKDSPPRAQQACQRPCPTSRILEQFYYPSPDTILNSIAKLLKLSQENIQSLGVSPEIATFKGPF